MCWITKQVSFFENNVLTSVEIGEWWTRVDSKMVLLYTIQGEDKTRKVLRVDGWVLCMSTPCFTNDRGRYWAPHQWPVEWPYTHRRSQSVIKGVGTLLTESKRATSHASASWLSQEFKGKKKKEKRDMWYRLYYLIESGYQNWFNI